MNNLDVNQVIDLVLNNVLDPKNQPYSKVLPQNIMDQIEKEQLQQIQNRWEDMNKRMNMIDFVKLLVSIIEHKKKELIFLVIGLIELFKEIVISTNGNRNELTITDITSFICEKTEQQDFELKLQEQRVPAPKKFDQDLDRIRQIDVEAPQVVNQTTLLSHIMPNKIKTDKVKHINGTVQSGVYMEEQNRVITLDCLGTKLHVYDVDCQIQSYITLKNPTKKLDEDKEAIILGFAWSSRQQRVGIILKSHYMCFFDQNDNFQLPRMFSTQSYSQDHQTQIWCLNNYNYWITTDASNRLYRWDIQEQRPVQIFQSSKIKSSIIEIIEVLHLKLMATASLDKQIALWDILRGEIKISINMEEHGGIHSMVYSYSYQIIITCGYSTNIQIFQIHPLYMDVTLVGRLQGHASMLTAITMLGMSPILCSGDDIGTIRLWNIKNFQCVQCLSYGRRTQILKLLDISSKGMICFLGSRLNMIQLDDRQKTKINDSYPTGIEFYPNSEQLVVASRKEVLFINIHTGRTKKIYSSLLQDEEDEIVQFKSTNHFNRFILGDSRGGLNLYQSTNGELLKQMKGHQADVTHLKIDINNNLIISACQDQFIVQRQHIGNGIGNDEPETLREVHKFQQGVEIAHLEISVHHNIILAASLIKISIYDYELLRLLGEINADKDSDISFLSFIRLFNIFAVGSNVVKIFSFIVRNQQEIHLDIIAILDPFYLLTEIKYVSFTPEQTKGLRYSDTLFSLTEVWKLPEGCDSYNPQLVSQQQREGFDVPTKCLVGPEESTLQLYIATNKGQVFITDLSELIDLFQLQTSIHSFDKQNYNPYRAIKETYAQQLNKCKQPTFQPETYMEKNYRKILLIPKKALLMTFHAQKKSINCLYILQLDKSYIATTAVNGFINIHNILDGIMVASLNINHPLPILWSLIYTKREQLRKKIIYALKIVEVLQKQAQSYEEKQIFNINNFVSTFFEPDLQKQQYIAQGDKCVMITQPSKIFNLPIINSPKKVFQQIKSTDPTNKVIVMTDEYTPRDLQFDSIRKQCLSEIQGPSIKQMDTYTRFQDSQAQEKADEIAQLEYERIFELKEQEKLKLTERGGSISFLDEYYHQKVSALRQTNKHNNNLRWSLEVKLDSCVKGVRVTQTNNDHLESEKLLSGQKKTSIALKKHHKSVQSKDFIQYASDRNMVSMNPAELMITQGGSSQVMSHRSSFNPTFFMKNIDKVGQINVDNSQKWLGGQKQKRFQMSHVLQSLNMKVIKSKLQVDQELGIINKNLSSRKVSYSQDTQDQVIDDEYNEQQAQADKKIDKIVVQIRNRVQHSLRIKRPLEK